MLRRILLKITGLVLCALLIAITSTHVALAAGPEETPPSINPPSDDQLLLHMDLIVNPDESVDWQGYRFSYGSRSVIQDQRIWYGRTISFDNRCHAITPLNDPLSIKVEGESGYEVWGRSEIPVNFSPYFAIEPMTREIEIINQSGDIVAEFDVTDAIDDFCYNNGDNTFCMKRKNYVVLLDDPTGIDELFGASIESFETLTHMSEFTESENVSVSGKNGGMIAVNIGKTSTPWEKLWPAFTPINSSYETVLINNLKSGFNADDTSEDLDGFLTINFKRPVKGTAFKLGVINTKQAAGEDRKSYELSKYLVNATDPDEIPSLAMELSRLTGKSVNAKVRVFDNEKELVVDKIIAIDSLPGTHAFLGVMMPSSRIGSIEIEYQGQPTFEVIGDITVFDGDLSKIAGVPFDEDEQHCDSPLSTDRVISSIPGPLPMFPPLNQELIPVVPTPTPTIPVSGTITPPRLDLSGPGRESTSGSNPLSGSNSSEEPVIETRPDRNDRDEEPQEAAVSCNSTFGNGGSSSSEGVVIAFGLISLFAYLKRRQAKPIMSTDNQTQAGRLEGDQDQELRK